MKVTEYHGWLFIRYLANCSLPDTSDEKLLFNEWSEQVENQKKWVQTTTSSKSIDQIIFGELIKSFWLPFLTLENVHKNNSYL